MLNKLNHPVPLLIFAVAMGMGISRGIDVGAKSRIVPLTTVKGFPPELERYIDDKEKQTISEDSAYKYVRENFDLDKNKKLSPIELELARNLSSEMGKDYLFTPYNVDTSKRNIFKAIEKIREEEKTQ